MSDPKRFPVLGTGGSIPWAIAEEAYLDYSKRYGTDQSLERLAQRGGFAPEELDQHRPGWRPAKLLIDTLTTERDALRQELSTEVEKHQSTMAELATALRAHDKLRQEVERLEGEIILLRGAYNGVYDHRATLEAALREAREYADLVGSKSDAVHVAVMVMIDTALGAQQGKGEPDGP